MTGRPANNRLSHRWCQWCGETIKPPGFILTEQEWRAWPAQFCSSQCADDYASDVWDELRQQQASVTSSVQSVGPAK